MALTLPPGFQAVGIRNGRDQVINRGQDQAFVFAMLKAIPESQGGAQQRLAGESVPILGDRLCSSFLADLIVQFQRKSAALTSKDGVVDAGGATLRLMMKLSGASGAVPPVPKPGGGAVPNSEPGLPAQRHKLLQAGLNWTRSKGGGPYKPSARELMGFFATARTEALPTLAEAEKSLRTLSSGCYIQGSSVRHWCGIFACAVAVSAGLTSFRWTLHGGKIIGPQLIMGHQDMLPGDIAIISQFSHHFLITGFPNAGRVKTLEGNTTGQLIRASERQLSTIVGFYRTVPL
jgi:hypothetical protein